MSNSQFKSLAEELQEIPETIPEPFQGRLLIKVMHEDVMEYKRKQLGMAEDSKILLPTMLEENKVVPIDKGMVLKRAKDAYGEAYKRRFGQDADEAKEGDIVYFIKHQSYRCHVEDIYHIIGDCDVIGRVKKEIVEKTIDNK